MKALLVQAIQKKVLVECAYFIPEVILGKTRKYNPAQMLALNLREELTKVS